MILLVKPPLLISSPASRKNGHAISENELRSPQICWTKTDTSMLEQVRIPITPESPIAKAIGVPITIKTINIANDTSSNLIHHPCL